MSANMLKHKKYKRFRQICYLVIISFCIITFMSCEDVQYVDKNVIASVYKDKLFVEDILSYMPRELSEEDSLLFVENYINNWITDKLLYYNAKNELRDTFDIVYKINEYRTQLYVHKYKEHLIDANLNMNVPYEEIIDYYDNNLSELTLDQIYVKAHYLTINVLAETYYRERYAVLETEAGDHQKLLDFCEGTGRRAYFLDEWTKLDDLLRTISYIEVYNPNRLRYDRLIVSTDNEFRYIVKINDYLLKGSPVPVEIIKSDIIEIILNKRKKDMLEQKKKELISEGIRMEYVNVYLN